MGVSLITLIDFCKEFFFSFFNVDYSLRETINKKKSHHYGRIFFIGGGKEDRTPDLMIANHSLSQLSYTPMLFLYSHSTELYPHKNKYRYRSSASAVLLSSFAYRSTTARRSLVF